MTRRITGLVLAAALSLGVPVLSSACSATPGREPPPQVPGGDPARGSDLIQQFGCGACHMIPGVRDAVGMVGPPLIHWSQRGFIAGQLPNNAQNLIRWIMDPPGVEPGTAMPNLHLSEQQARDIAAYLFALK
jgi:cytochrome c1